MSAETTTQELTLGQRRVRVSFNTNQLETVQDFKNATAKFIDLCEKLRLEIQADISGKYSADQKARAGRELSIAQTEAESACHWAVKGATVHL